MSFVRLARRLRQRGAAAVELAFVLVPLVLMIFGTTEFGRAIYTYNTLDKSVRDAARHLSQHGPGDDVVQAEARCLAAYGNLACSGDALAPGLTVANIGLCDAISCPGSHAAQPTGAGAVNLVSATVHDYAYGSVVEFVMPSLTFNHIAVTMRAQL
ncbi:MAG TPA: TadE family protein [Albitalea sp.]|nr:TadE family protein [Albitalea sp.]